MLQVAARRRVAAVLAAAAFTLCHGMAAAQQANPPVSQQTPLDPSAPLAPMPDLGVDWPTTEDNPATPIAPTPDTSIADAEAERAYDVRLEGLDEVDAKPLITQFNQLSTLQANHKEKANAAQIDRRARDDADLLGELLRADGYYDALVDTRVEVPAGNAPITVVLHAEPGPLYHFADVRLPGLEEAGGDASKLREAFPVNTQDPVNTGTIIAAEATLKVALGQSGYAFAEMGAPDITVDHATRTATLVLPVKPNGLREFGRIIIQGKPLFSAHHVQEIARFRTGQQYKAALVEDLRRALVATGIVGSAEVTPVERAGTKLVDIQVRLTQAPLHTVAGEAGYGTGEGFRVEASWQHRNLIKPEGAVTVRGVLGTQEQTLGVSLRQNNFHRRDQILNAQIAASNLNQPAYSARTFAVSANIERQTNIIWQKKWTWSLGPQLIASDERDVDIASAMTRRRTYLIAALPGTLAYDGSNDLLDPTRGFRLSGFLSPEFSLQNGAFGYTRTQVDGSFYLPMSNRITIAARARFGTIFGASRDRIAPSRRFYAGGGGSVRGFGYQDLGPRDPVFKDPIGGRSLAEFSIESRIRMGNFGIVPFLDAGNIYTSPVPQISHLRFGAGIGLRYHTSFGPIRVDVGTPLGRRPGEPRIAVYVGLGQAF